MRTKTRRSPLSPAHSKANKLPPSLNKKKKETINIDNKRFSKVNRITVNVADANRPPKSVELAIRGSYGLLINKPKKFHYDENLESDENTNSFSLDNLPAWADKSDVIVQHAAINRLKIYNKHSAAIIIQHNWRLWASKQMCKAWVDFNSMHAINENDEYSSNLFQARLAERAYSRLQGRQLKLFFNCWMIYTKSFKRIRER